MTEFNVRFNSEGLSFSQFKREYRFIKWHEAMKFKGGDPYRNQLLNRAIMGEKKALRIATESLYPEKQ
jgi:hypothetical protein